jgi:hypothetical protein
VIKLSDAVQKLPRQVTCNVHGVGSNFLAIGRAKRAATAEEYGGRRFSKVRRPRARRGRGVPAPAPQARAPAEPDPGVLFAEGARARCQGGGSPAAAG